MTRSEFKEILQREGSLGQIETITRTLEIAGMAWDPEEPKLPKRLSYVRMDCSLWPEGRVGDSTVTGDEAHAYTFEAARRYNLWPELRKAAKSSGITRILSLLDGGGR